ncbi:hypothetical protein HGRIS_008452 [Hohenbuehelia grisea]|uniref:Uncharacterized protein n=1 Tax=Hohenbuehelia grisea TaxID=104357 RepID=A0ABR3J801_9AGAR
MHSHRHYADNTSVDYAGPSYMTSNSNQPSSSSAPMRRRNERPYQASMQSMPGPSNSSHYFPHPQQPGSYMYAQYNAPPHAPYYPASSWASSSSSVPESSGFVDLLSGMGVSSVPSASIASAGKYAYTAVQTGAWPGSMGPTTPATQAASGPRLSVSPAESSSGSDSSYLDPGDSLTRTQMAGSWANTSQPPYQHPIPLDNPQYPPHMSYGLQAAPSVYPTLQVPHTLNTNMPFAPPSALPAIIPQTGAALSHSSASPPTPSSPPPATPSPSINTLGPQTIPIHAPKPCRLDVKAWLAKSALESLTESESGQEPEPPAPQATLPPFALLCQPAPSSILFPPKAADASGMSVQHPQHAAQEALHSDLFAAYASPYDIGSQNVLVCNCGCMESYSVS